ncbi:hypothetical protein ACFQU2_39275 [Siccirubricoccus deserti]
MIAAADRCAAAGRRAPRGATVLLPVVLGLVAEVGAPGPVATPPPGCGWVCGVPRLVFGT